jgi:hypothetical protein
LTGHSFRPTRLLDLEHFGDSQDLVLVSTSLLGDLSYVTLSHCWGASVIRPLSTTTSNLENRMRSISFATLPLTFQDAVQITRKLKIRYLWIDSLCIIQDSNRDWEREAAVMGRIYAHSFCTLAASASTDSSGGCRVPEKRMQYPLYKDVVFGGKGVRFFVKPRDAWKDHFIDSGPEAWADVYNTTPLRFRAWTLQERELSPRVLHFTKHQLLWECRTLKASSEIPWKETATWDKSRRRNRLFDDELKVDAILQRSTETSNNWFGVIEDFSGRFITVGTDKLPALSGLAHEVQSGRGRYAAGLWETDMPCCLLWNLRQAEAATRPSEYRAPTWSWAALDGEVRYEAMSHGHDSDPAHIENSVDEVHTDLAGEDPMWQVCGGYIKLSVPLREAVTVVENPEHRGERSIRDLEGIERGAINIDILPEYIPNQVIYCINLYAEHPNTPTFRRPYREGCNSKTIGTFTETLVNYTDLVMGLALVKTGRQTEYRRLGIVRWMERSWFKGIKPTIITII